MPIKLAIADDHQLILSSISEAVKRVAYIEVTGTYKTGEELQKGLEQAQPDVLLLDYHLPDQNGAQLARFVTYHYPRVRILALTGFEKPGLATEMLESGCMGYLLKATVNAQVIIEAIERLYEGHMYIDAALRDKYASTIRRNNTEAEDAKAGLTDRELEVLRGIVAEQSSQEIADRLFISKRTVDHHRHSIMMKSGTKSIVGLIKFAIERKLV